MKVIDGILQEVCNEDLNDGHFDIPNGIVKIRQSAFSNCSKLKSVFFPQSVIEIGNRAFKNCRALETVIMSPNVRKIGRQAFCNCFNLSKLDLPSNLEELHDEAFKNCQSIKKINIPPLLTKLPNNAFLNMRSLEDITVSPDNKAFSTFEHKILIDNHLQALILYAAGCPDKTFSLKDYCVSNDNGSESEIINYMTSVISFITSIGSYAFAGAKNLEELTICSCTDQISANAFKDCDNLKTLNVEGIPFSSSQFLFINLENRANAKELDIPPFPFETINFKGDFVRIGFEAYSFLPVNGYQSSFRNVKNVTLPTNGSYLIDRQAFSNSCPNLEKVFIPAAVSRIIDNAFPSTTELIFENGLHFKNLHNMERDVDFLGEYELYALNDEDGTYFIKHGDNVMTITKKQIQNICSHPKEILSNPILFITYMNDLLEHDLVIKPLLNGILMTSMGEKTKRILFANLKKDDAFFINVLENSKLLDELDEDTKDLLSWDNHFNKVIDYINVLRKYNITDPILHHKILMNKYPVEKLEQLIKLDLPLLEKILTESHFFDSDLSNMPKPVLTLTNAILANDNLTTFFNLIKKYDIKDKYLYNKHFIGIADNPLFAQMLKVYDANTKRVLKMSQAINDHSTDLENLANLLILMKITGALEEDAITRQRASTFICEKIFDEYLPTGEKNAHCIVGDDLHRIFNFKDVCNEFDEGYAKFFLENYAQLYEEEKNRSGFIERTYANFKILCKTNTSHKGEQRPLKVTIDKCRNYFNEIKFDGVTEDLIELAAKLGKWFDKNEDFIKAKGVYYESFEAPRNIFTSSYIDDVGKVIYDNSPTNDLREEISPDFSYEWLPKQDADNLILGKYCNCCAHVAGAGSGIMRASMISPDCQNLIIRDGHGQIVAKATIAVNREQGYAVFNTIESSLSVRYSSILTKITKAFLRGTKAFFDSYNTNNPDQPLKEITVGSKRNTIFDFLDDEKYPTVPVHQSLKYGDYAITNFGYDGDWSVSQKLLIKSRR